MRPAFAVAATPPQGATPVFNDYLARYTLDDATGDDETGNYDLAPSGTTNQVVGSIDSAQEFAGAEVKNGVMALTLSSITLASWVYLPATRLAGYTFALCNILGGEHRAGFLLGTDGKVTAKIQQNASGNYTTGVEMLAVSDGWHHLAMSFDTTGGTSKRMAAYLDGALVLEKQQGTSVIDWSNISKMVLGSRYGSTNLPYEYFTGYLDDVRVYDRTLTDTDIAALAADIPDYLELTGITSRALYDPTDVSNITDTGGLVDVLEDSGSVGTYDVGQTGTARPTTGTKTLNDLNVLDMDGVDSLFDADFEFPADGDTMIIGLAKVDNVSGEGDSLWSFLDDDVGAHEWNFRSGYTTGGKFWGDILGSNISTPDGMGKPSTGQDDWAIWGTVFDKTVAAEISVYLNGVLGDNPDNPTTYDTAVGTDGKFSIFSNKAGTSKPRGEFFGAVVLDVTDTTNRQKVEGIYARMSGRVDLLDVTHPYKYQFPRA